MNLLGSHGIKGTGEQYGAGVINKQRHFLFSRDAAHDPSSGADPSRPVYPCFLAAFSPAHSKVGSLSQ